jgi:hypothetical protein
METTLMRHHSNLPGTIMNLLRCHVFHHFTLVADEKTQRGLEASHSHTHSLPSPLCDRQVDYDEELFRRDVSSSQLW